MSDANIGPSLAGTMGGLFALSLVTFAMRAFSRVYLTRSWGLDDTFLALALLSFLPFCGFSFVHLHFGTGRHEDTLSTYQIKNALKWYYFGEIFYAPTATFLRLSIGFLLLRLVQRRWQRQIIMAVLISSTLMGIATTAFLIFQCQPISFYWNTVTASASSGHCIDADITVYFAYAHAAGSCLSDWSLGIIPWFIVMDLLDRKHKLQVAALLCFANIGSIATIVRFYSIQQLAETEDFLYNTVPLACWSIAEVGIGLSAASIASLHPLYVWVKCSTRSRRGIAGRSHVSDVEFATIDSHQAVEVGKSPAVQVSERTDSISAIDEPLTKTVRDVVL